MIALLNHPRAVFCALSWSLALAGCGEEDGTGGARAELGIWGEELIERGIPAEEFADGWSVEFDQFLVVVSQVHLASAQASGGRCAGPAVVDLVRPGPHALCALDLPAGRYERAGYTIAPLTADDEPSAALASPAQLALLQTEGHSVYVAGTAARERDSLRFAWGFSGATEYADCVAVRDGREQPGVTLTEGNVSRVELTIHGDHLFYDDLASPDAALRFEPLARADADSDGEVTLDELAAVRLVDIEEGPYGTGSESDVDDLAAFVRAQATTLGHFQGEGHCVTSSRP